MSDTNPTVDAINAGENRYRQSVLGQSPLPGHPKIESTSETLPSVRAEQELSRLRERGGEP